MGDMLEQPALTLDERAALARIGRKGGLKTKERMGQEHYSRIGKIAGEIMRSRGSDFFREIGAKGRAKREQRAKILRRIRTIGMMGKLSEHDGPGDVGPIEVGVEDHD